MPAAVSVALFSCVKNRKLDVGMIEGEGVERTVLKVEGKFSIMSFLLFYKSVCCLLDLCVFV